MATLGYATLDSATSAVPVAQGGTGASSSGITAFNNITGLSAAGTTGTTSTNLVFSTSPTLVTPSLGVATATSITLGAGTELSSYVVGTFTPTVTLVGGAGNTVPNYTTNTGQSTRVGNMAWASYFLNGNGGTAGAGSGIFNLALPYTAASDIGVEFRTTTGVAYISGAFAIIHGVIVNNATTVSMRYLTSVSAISAFTGDQQNNADRAIEIAFWYKCA